MSSSEFVTWSRRALALASLALNASTGARAKPFPPGAHAEHVKQVGFSSLGGRFGGYSKPSPA